MSPSRMPASMRPHARRAALSFLALLSAACSDPGTGPGPRQEPERHELLFVAAALEAEQPVWGLLRKDIFRMRADGAGRENVTRFATFSYGSMSLSPDGRSVAFYSTRDGCPAVWTMGVDGSGMRNLSAVADGGGRCDRTPRWSRDGARLAFNSTLDGTSAVFVMEADGSDPRNVSAPLDRVAGSASYPAAWMPDGRLVFHHYAPGEPIRAYVVSTDGTGLAPLFGRTTDRSPMWSPDRSQVAFIRDEEDGRSRLYVMDADGSNVRALTDHAGADEVAPLGSLFSTDHDPWSPDGTRIAFVNVVDFRAALHVIGADGTGHARLVERGDRVAFEGWAPDGRVTFSAMAGAATDLFLVGADGTGVVNLTGTGDVHEGPALWVTRP